MLVDAGEVFERLGFETEWVPDMQALAIHSFPSFLQARVVGRVMDEVLCRVLAALEPAFACDHPLLSRAAHMRQTWSEEGRVFGSLKSDDLFHLFQATVACHSAVRSGEELHEDQVNHLLGRAADVDFAAHCPHGRPVLRKFSLQDVEAWFYR
jgi:DNA mismatch repair protein MutL